jgi:hypothetical protein
VSQILSTFRVVYWLERVSFDIYIIVYYVCIFLIFFTIINMAYVAYCFRQKKFPFTWPIPLLKYSCNLITTVLFIPILGNIRRGFIIGVLLELFMKLSQCGYIEISADSGSLADLRHQLFPEI